MIKAILFFIGLICLSHAQTTTMVLYVKSGDTTRDAGSVSSLNQMVSLLNRGGAESGNRYVLGTCRDFSEAFDAKDNPGYYLPQGAPTPDKIALVAHGILSATDGTYYGMLKDTEGSKEAKDLVGYFHVVEHCTQTEKSQHDIGNVIATRNGHDYPTPPSAPAAPPSGGTSSSPADTRSGGSPAGTTGGRWVAVQIYTERGYNAPDGSYHVEGTYSTVYVWIPDTEYSNMACIHSRNKLLRC